MRGKKQLRSLICLLLCLSMVLQPLTMLAGASEANNLLSNGTFEDADADGKADGWSYWNGTAVAAESSVGEDGLSITADSSEAAQRLSVHQTVSGLDSTKTYRFTGEYNVESTSGGALQIGYYANATGSRVDAIKQQSATDGWQSFDITFTGCEKVKVESAVSQGATMTVQVSNFCLTEVADTSDTPVETTVPATTTVPVETTLPNESEGEIEPDYVDTLLKNGTFLDGDGDGKADFWTYWNGTVAAANSSISEDGLTITADSSAETQRLTVHQTADVETGSTYRLTGRYQVSSTGVGSLEIRYNAGGSNVTAAKHTAKTDGWLTLDQEIVAEGTSLKLEIVVSSGATLTCSIDDVSLTLVPEEEPEPDTSAELLLNGSFADADENNQADNWSYWNGTAAAADSSIGEDGLTITADSSSETQRLTVHQTVTGLDSTKTYKFTGEYNVLSTGSGALEIGYIPNASGSRTNAVKATSKTDGWQTFEVTFTGCSSVKVESAVSSGATMTVQLKNFSLTEVVAEPEPDPTPDPEPDDSAELLLNGSFADADEDNQADNWNYWNGTAAAAASSIGEDGLTITADSSASAQRLTVHQTVTGLDSTKTYKFTGEYNVLSTGSGALEIGYIPNASGSRTNAVKATSKTDGWQTFEVTFTGCSGVKVESAVSSGATMTVQLKNFSLTEVTSSEEPPVEDDNLIENPTFANDSINSINNWNYYPGYAANAGTNYNASVADGVFTGEVLGGSNLILHQTIQLTEDQLNKTYTFTGDVKTEDLSSYAVFKIYLQDASNTQLSSFLSTQVNGNTDWTTLTVEFEVPAEIGGKAVAAMKLEQYILKGTGTAHFRNPKIVKTGDFIALPEGDPVDSLIKNGGYETTLAGFPASWNLWQSTGGLNAVSDRDVVKEGYSSLHLSNVTEGSDSRGSVHQTFTITEDLQELWGQSVKIGQWVKTENFVGDALALRVHYATVSGSYISKSLPVAATQDWTYYEYIIDLPASFQTIKVENLYDYAQGHVWIDNTVVTGYIKATGINLNHDTLVMQVGDTEQLELQYVPANTTVKEVIWSGSNDSVITVSDTGLVTAVAAGVAKVTITHVDGTRKELAVLVAEETLEYTEQIKIETRQNAPVSGTLPEGYTYAVAAVPQYGTFLVEEDVNYLYYPETDFNGTDTVTLLVTDAEGKQTLVLAELAVESVNAAPAFGVLNILTSVNKPVSGTIEATDPENDSLTFAIVTAPGHGEMTLDGSTYTYTPAANFSGYDTAVISADDGNGNVVTTEATIYVAPDVEDLLNTVKSEHSRLLADDARFEELKELIQTDENARLWFTQVKQAIDPLLSDTTPVPYQCPDGVRLDTQGSKDVLNLAFMWRVTGDQAYFDRAWLELECLSNPETYPDWHPSHLLDTAMTANGVAIAYDWMYEDLNEEQRAFVEAAIYKNGLQEALKQFQAKHMFVTNLNNWNYVCNGGFITAALAMAHHENQEYHLLAGDIIQRCYQSIQYGLPQYAPEGDSIEGISYWDYGTRYLVSLMASITSATNVENPFLNAPGLDLTALYPIYMSGKAGTYNYSDNDMTDAVGYLNLWLAEVYGEPSWTWYHKYYMEMGYTATVYDLLYYNPEYYKADAPTDLDAFYTSQAVTTMRSDFTDPNGSFLGFKGGLNGAAHGDIDIGSFIYDLDGQRWALDFGKENYNLVGYWEIAPGGTRWNYYRKNALGHNTLVFNPENGANQTVGAYAGVEEASLNNDRGGYTILNMTSAYQQNAVSVKRGFAYFDRVQVLIRDEYTLKAVGDAYWQMHTAADVTISGDGKTATLTQNGKTLLLKLLDADENLQFAAMEAKPYAGLNTYDGENANEGITKLYIQATGVQKGVFNVLITPEGMEEPAVKPLSSWSSYDFEPRKTCGENLYWELDENGILTISGTGAMYDYTADFQPWNAAAVTEIVLNEGITGIGAYAFYDCAVSEILIPASVETIGENALPRSLEKIQVAEGNLKYASRDGVLFSADMTVLIRYPAGSQNESYEIPETVLEIADNAFASAENLKQISFAGEVPENLENGLGGMDITVQYPPEPEPDVILVAGKSVSLIAQDAQGNALKANTLNWILDPQYAPFASVNASGKVTAAKVLQQVTVIVNAVDKADAETVVDSFRILICPAANFVEITRSGEVVNNKTINVNLAGESLTLTAAIHPLDAQNGLSWTISDKKDAFAVYTVEGNVLTVDPKADAKSGQVTIKVTTKDGSNKSAAVKLRFGIYASSVEIDESIATLTAGDKAVQLKATADVDTKIVWSLKKAEDKNYVSLSSSGKLTPKNVLAPVKVTVVATSKDGMASDEHVIEILPENAGQLVIKSGETYVTKTTQILDVNAQESITLAAYTYGAEEMTPVTWTAPKTESAIITNNDDGTLTIQVTAAGTINVTAKTEDKRTATVTIKAAKLARDITVVQKKTGLTEGLELASGKSLDLEARLTDADSKKVTWTIEKGDAFAAVSASGKVTAHKNLTSGGEVIVRAVAADGSEVTDTIHILVYPIAQGVQICTLAEGQMLFSVRTQDWWVRSNTTLSWDLSAQPEVLDLRAIVFPYYGEENVRNAIQKVTWKSSAPKVADIVDGQLKIYNTGNATITATAADGSGKKVSFKLNVVKSVTELTIDNQEVQGGKSINLNKRITINPGDATNKKLNWDITSGGEYATISNGTFKAKKVTETKTVEVTVSSQDGGASTRFCVTIIP